MALQFLPKGFDFSNAAYFSFNPSPFSDHVVEPERCPFL